MYTSLSEQLLDVCENGNLDSLISILDEMGTDIGSYVDVNNLKLKDTKCTLLHIAARHNHTHIMEFLYSRGASLEVVDKSDMTPLHYAARDDCLDAITFLAAKGAQMNVKDCFEFTPLAISLVNKQYLAADLLVVCKADMHVKVTAKQCPVLHVVCKGGLVDSVKFLLDRGASLLRKDRNAESVLCVSVAHYEVLEILCKYAKEQKILPKLLRMTANTGENVFHYFANVNDSSIKGLELLIDSIVPTSYTTLMEILNEQEKKIPLNTALHLAVEKGRFDMVDLLCTYSEFLHFDIRNGEGDTALHMAIKQGNFEIFNRLLSADQDGKALFISDAHGYTPEALLHNKEAMLLCLKLAIDKRQNRTAADILRSHIPRHSFTCLIMLQDSQLSESVFKDLNTLADLFYAYNSSVIGVSSKSQSSLNEVRRNSVIKFRVLSDEENSIAIRYAATKKKEIIPRFLKREHDVASASVLLLDANEIVICQLPEVSSDVIRVLSYYLKCIKHDASVRIKAMLPKHDIFDWILQNDIICKNFAMQLSAGLENNSFMFGNIQQVMKTVEAADLSTRKKSNDGEDLGMVHLYQRYIMRQSPLGLPKGCCLSPKNNTNHAITDFNPKRMRQELRREAFLLYMESKHIVKRHKTIRQQTSPVLPPDK